MNSPSLDRIFATVNGYQMSDALRAGVELDLFTAIDNGHKTVPELAQQLQVDPRGIRILCDCLVIYQLLEAEPESYGLTIDSKTFLSQNSAQYVGTTVKFLLSSTLREGFGLLTQAVRQGGTALDSGGTVAPDHQEWVNFARNMAPMMGMIAHLTAQKLELPSSGRVLDVAAGHGLFGIALLQRYPELESVALDWPAVLEVARENAVKAGVESRLATLPGDAFQVDFGGPYQAVLLPNFLHHFSEDENVDILSRARASLSPDGCVAIVEFVPDENRLSPPGPATFNLIMLATTPKGEAYRRSDLERMARKAGFTSTDWTPLEPTSQTLLVLGQR